MAKKKKDERAKEVIKAEKKAEAKMTPLERAKMQARKQFGKEAVPLLDISNNVEFTSTGNIMVNYACGGGNYNGGFPRGRHIEIFGKESVGKTTFTIQYCALMQTLYPKQAILYMDYENTFDPVYAKALGLDLADEHFQLLQPRSFEEGMTIAEKFIVEGAVSVVVVDTLAACLPAALLEEEFVGKGMIGVHAKAASATLMRMTGIVNEQKVVWIWINQMRSKIGVMFGNKDVTTGGNALQFYASMRLNFLFVGGKKTIQKDAHTGKDITVLDPLRIRVTAVKNKCAPPYFRAEYDMKRGLGVDNVGSLIELLEHWHLIKVTANGYYSFKPEFITMMGKTDLKADENYLEDAFRNMIVGCKDKIEAVIKQGKIAPILDAGDKPLTDVAALDVLNPGVAVSDDSEVVAESGEVEVKESEVGEDA